VGHVARTDEMRNTYKIWVRTLKRRDHLGDLAVDGITTFRCILEKHGAGLWAGFI